MVSAEQFKRGVANYADREIIDRLPAGSVKRVLVGSALAIAMQRGMEKLCADPLVLSLGIVSSDKMVDVDLLRETLLCRIPPEGMTVNTLGVSMTFRADDVEAVYRCVMEC